MAEAPKIVRDYLRSQVVGEHPDANLLSAFIERGLTEPERAQVLDHLSCCGDCRQVVALTAPELAEQRPAAVRTPARTSRSWWRSPLLHWGAFTAAALVVLITVGARMRLREGRSASAPAIATSIANEAEEKRAIAPPEVSPPPAEPKPSSKKVAKPSPLAGGIIGGSADEVAGFGTGGSTRLQNAAPSPPPPAAVAPQMQAKAADTGGGLPLDSGIEKSRQKATPAPPVARETAIVTDTAAAPALKSEGAASSKSQSVGMLARRASLTARWSVSDAGVLQRSFDGGRSWRDVAIGDGVTFRAVATVGSDVWAGGSGAALFHSADAGEHWSRMPVLAKGRAASGDIVRIEFADTRKGAVTTSTGETWDTSDGGASWLQQ